MNTLLENTHLLSLEQEKSPCSVVKESTGDSLSTSCAASPSSPKLETEPSANQVSSLSCTESQFIWTDATSAKAERREPEKKLTTCGTQWLASDAGDALLHQEHNYTFVFHHGIRCLYSLSLSPFTRSHLLRPRSKLHLVTDVTIDNDVNDNSLQVSFDDDTVSTTVPFKSAVMKRLGKTVRLTSALKKWTRTPPKAIWRLIRPLVTVTIPFMRKCVRLPST